MATSVKAIFPYLKFIWAGVILFLTLKPGNNEPLFAFLAYPGVDKAGHFVMFFFWALLQFPEAFFRKSLRNPAANKFWRVATNSLVLGLGIEAVQYFVPGRSAEMLDLLADMLGVAAALVAVKVMRS